ncbi:MAG: hypothetical protein NC489_44150 [Ruminococcus flavefaciens]|nr:hypothetical protein [Ruminococcus flavefaciens]
MKQEQKLTSIGIVICYIGKLPEWFPLWVKSCAENPSIDFLLYTDNQLGKLPDNIIFHATTLEELKKKFSKILGFACKLDSPYKLCDYKVIYGEAFQEDLRQYNFWGHCDLDMIFGNLRNFITEDVLKLYDRIFEVGHLCLYRNCIEINRLYRKAGAMIPFETVFREKRYCGFDEHTGLTRICGINHIKTYKKIVCADIDPHYRAFYMMDEDSVNGEMMVKNYKYQIFIWDRGKTWQVYLDKQKILHKNEVSYIHFMRKYPTNVETCLKQDSYCITYKEFIPYSKSNARDFVLQNSFATNATIGKIEYISMFIQNGIRALKKGELGLRIKLRINRIKKINAKKVGG